MEQQNRDQVFYANCEWRYERKSVNLSNFTISYEVVGHLKTREDAEKAKERDDNKYKKDLEKIKKIANAEYTFKEYVKYWLTSEFLQNTDSATRVVGTWAVNKLIIPSIQQDVLLPYIMIDYINDIIKRSIPICESAGHTVSKYMKLIVYSAYIHGLIPTNLKDKIMSVPEKAPKIQLLNSAQLSAFLTAAQKHDSCYFEILLALFAGLRSGEIRGLKYSDFNKKNKTLRIARQCTSNYALAESNDNFEFQYYLEEKEPKGSSARTLKIPDFFFTELEIKKKYNKILIENARRRGEKNIEKDYICLSVAGHRKKKNSLLASVKRVCREALVPEISPHTLRHQFATLLLEKGVPLEQISHLLGHKSVTTTFNVYCGIIDARKDAKNVITELTPYVEDNQNGVGRV